VIFLGHAYGLHFAQVAEPALDTVWDPSQCEWLQDELRLLSEIVADEATRAVLSIIHQLAARVARNSGLRLLISPP
jgi:hypothetical protein